MGEKYAPHDISRQVHTMSLQFYGNVRQRMYLWVALDDQCGPWMLSVFSPPPSYHLASPNPISDRKGFLGRPRGDM